MANNVYSISENLEEFQEKVLVSLSEGYDLIGTTYGDGKWIASYQDTPGLSSFYSASSPDELIQTVQTRMESRVSLS